MTHTDAIAAAFSRSFGSAPAGVWAAPGRVNLIGEHTDYNGGFVLPLAIEQRCVLAAAPADGSRTRLRSTQGDQLVEVDAATVAPGDVQGWAAYLAGMFWSLREAGNPVPQLDVLIDSDVPIGAGLSSSAALECAIGLAIVDLGGEEDIPRTELALLAQRCENDFVGAATGTMDQLASMHGRAGHLVFIDTRENGIEHVPFDLAGAGLALLVVDTKAPHALVDGQYAARRHTCEEAARILGVEYLRDVTLDDLSDALRRLPDEESRRRVRHVVTEDSRVLDVVRHLRSGADPRGIGEAMTASHASLRDDYEVTVPHLDVAVEAALDAGAHGARMTGGGFGGSIIALVDSDAGGGVVDAVRAAYASRGFEEPATFVALPADGADRLR